MANGSGQVPVIAIARESWMFFLQNWRMFLPAAGVPVFQKWEATSGIAKRNAPAHLSESL